MCITCSIALARGLFHAQQCFSAGYIQEEQKYAPWTKTYKYAHVFKKKREIILLIFH